MVFGDIPSTDDSQTAIFALPSFSSGDNPEQIETKRIDLVEFKGGRGRQSFWQTVRARTAESQEVETIG